MRKRLTVAIGLVLAITAFAPLRAQEPAAGQFGEELTVTEVLLDVLVTDRQGNVILGLDQDDFIVEEGGEPVDVTGATFYSNRRFVDSADIASRLGVDKSEVPVDRFFILFFHDQRRLSTDLVRNQIDAVRRVKEWIYDELLPNDYVAVVSYDARLRIHQDFTTDNEAILRALDDVAKGRDPKGVWASRIAEHKGPSLAINLPKGDELARATRRVYGALDEIAKAAGYITGRKNLLLFSIGFGELNDFGTYNPDKRYYEGMMESLNDSNVAVYSIPWIENVADENAAYGTLNNVLSVLSEDTGGRYFLNFVDFKDPLREVTEDNGGYYLLAYTARHPKGESGYREVGVRTVNDQFVVRARQGYRYGG